MLFFRSLFKTFRKFIPGGPGRVLETSLKVFGPENHSETPANLRVPNGVFQTVFFRFLTLACERGEPSQRDKV